jgi:pimeloyl-ACP methyl ester carboxylesterase
MRGVFATGPGRPPLPEAVVDAYRANILRPGAATAMVNYYRAAARGRRDTGAWRTIDVPVLLLWGDADTALDIATTRGTEAMAPDLTFRRLAGVSHWVQQDAPDAVNVALREWLGPRGGS